MTEDIYDIDYETSSEVDLRKFGTARYAEDSSTRILMFAISKNGSEPIVWDTFDSQLQNGEAHAMLSEAVESGSRIYAHNYQFEHFISRYNLEEQVGIPSPALDNWRCTAAMARRAAIPFSLEQCGEFLGLGDQKDKTGKQLIQIFSVPKKGVFVQGDSDALVTVAGEKIPATEAWDKFCEYCRQDVRVQIDIRKKLAAFDFDLPKNADVLKGFLFDARLNDRGVPVNLPALAKTQEIVEEYRGRIGAKFHDLTGFNQTQRAKVLNWLQEGGYPADNLQAATVETVLEKKTKGMDVDAIEALKIYKLLSFAALAKIPAMLGAANEDGRVRGTLMWSGALRSHRWTGRIIQPQNMRRPTINDTDVAYELLCTEGTTSQDLDMFWESPLEVIASCIRHFIEDPAGKLYDVDYSNIESRILAWLAGETWKLEKFRNDEDLYKVLSSTLFGKPVSDITKPERFIGKVGELGCGYQTGPDTFSGMLDLYKYETPQDEIDRFWEAKAELIAEHNKVVAKTYSKNSDGELCFNKALSTKERITLKKEMKARAKKSKLVSFTAEGLHFHQITKKHVSKYLQYCLAVKVVKTWREQNPLAVKMWKDFDLGAKKAIRGNGKKVFVAGGKVYFQLIQVGFPALAMVLPSGHQLIYPHPELKTETKKYTDQAGETREWDADTIKFQGMIPNTNKFGRCSTYGGKLVENCVSGDAEVLTPHGWTRLDAITDEDVWDGEAFVSHKGLKRSGMQETIQLEGVRLTPDHKVLLQKGWTPAEECVASTPTQNYEQTYRHNQPNFWEPHCDQNDQHSGERKPKTMGVQMCLRSHETSHLPRNEEAKVSLMHSKMPLFDKQKTKNARDVKTPRICSVEVNVGTLQQPQTSGLQKLWSTGHKSLCRVVEKFRTFLGINEVNVPNRFGSGQKGQQPRLRPEKLQVGNTQNKLQQYKTYCESANTLGSKDLERGCKDVWDKEDNATLPNVSGRDKLGATNKTTKQFEEVYDLVDCGKNNRFVVRQGVGFKPFIVHNCCQAIGGDFLSHGVVKAEEAGFETFAIIHDQALAPVKDDLSLELYIEKLCDLPEWAKGFPLAGDGAIVKYYTKD